MKATSPPPILPLCSFSPEGQIEGIYAGRFVALPFDELVRQAAEAFPHDGSQRLARIVALASTPRTLKAQTSDLEGPEAVREALDDFFTIMREGGRVLREEIGHHKDLVRTPIWGLVNSVAVCERLHLTAAQWRYGKPRGAALAWSLGQALRLYVLRRYLGYQQMAIVETIFLLPALEGSESPTEILNQFEGTYGEEPGRLADAVWSLIHQQPHRRQALEEYRSVLLAALDHKNLLRPGESWLTLLQQGLELLDEASLPSRLADRALKMVKARAGGAPLPSPPEPLALPRPLVGYLLSIRGRGLAKLVFKAAFLGFVRTLVPLLPRLFSGDPYGRLEAAGDGNQSIPALRTYQQDGRGLIIDPAAVNRDSRRLNHSGMENLLEKGSSGYVADQYIIRRTIEKIADPLGIWSQRLQYFIFQWMATKDSDRERVSSILKQLDPLFTRLARATQRSREEICRGQYSSEMLRLHNDAREFLFHEMTTESNRDRPILYDLLHAYYMHGL